VKGGVKEEEEKGIGGWATQSILERDVLEGGFFEGRDRV